MPRPAIIALEDGSVFRGEAVTGRGSVGGELVVSTAASGHQQIVTDPVCCGQVVAFAFPMVGNHGADPACDESDRAHARAIVARELTNYRLGGASRTAWLDWLAERDVLAVSGVDTHALYRLVRERGALRAVVSTEMTDLRHLRQAAQKLPRAVGLDLVKLVTCKKAYEVPTPEGAPAPQLHVALYDFGVTRSLLRLLGECGFRVTVLPAKTSTRELLRRAPDGVVLSAGPGDPAAAGYAIKTVERLLGKLPFFGVGLGHQLLARAFGLPVSRLEYCRSNAAHAVLDLRSRAVELVSRHHGFAVRSCDAPGVEVTRVSVRDGAVEGLAAPKWFALSVQSLSWGSCAVADARHPLQRFRDEMLRFKAGAS